MNSSSAGSSSESAPAVLRAMAASDVDLITAMDAQLFGMDCWPRQLFVDELRAPQTRQYIVAEVPAADRGDGQRQIVGYAGLMCVPPVGDIQTIGVLPEFEGRGIARAMMVELVEEARHRGALEILLEVSSINPRAQELYRRFGFEHIHTRRRYYRDGSDGLVMRLSLENRRAGTGSTGATHAIKDAKDVS